MTDTVQPRFVLKKGESADPEVSDWEYVEIRCGGRSCRNRLATSAKIWEDRRVIGITLEAGYYQEANGKFYRGKSWRQNHPTRWRGKLSEMTEIRRQVPGRFPYKMEPIRQGFNPLLVPGGPPEIVVCHKCGAENEIASVTV